MRAAICRRYGPPEVVELAELPTPNPGPGEVGIRVVSSSVNRTDCGIRSASPWIARCFYGLRRPRRPVLGSEFAGVVDAVGPGVDRFAEGDRVFGFDDSGMGGHGDYLVRSIDGMIDLVPEGLSLAEAGAATEGAHYAGSILRATGVGPGSTVLVYGASGAIGSAAVQLAVHLGAEVVAVCGTDGVEAVGTLGASMVVDYQREGLEAIDRRFDLVMDAVGKTTFWACRHLLTPDGTFVSSEFGPWLQNPLLILPTRLWPGPRVRFPIPVVRHESMRFILDALVAGTYRPLIDRRYPLDDIVEAYRYVEQARKIGNVVLEVGEAH